MRDLFQQDPQRFVKFHLQLNDILFDFSKNIITDETLDLLLKVVDEVHLKEWIEKMFTGEKINITENRAVLHVALRNRSNTPIVVDGKDVMPEVSSPSSDRWKVREAPRSALRFFTQVDVNRTCDRSTTCCAA